MMRRTPSRVMQVLLALCCSISVIHGLQLASPTSDLLWSRVDFFQTSALSTSTVVSALLTPPPAADVTRPRTVDVGGGVDLLSTNPRQLAQPDVFFPASMEGLWQCRRIVTSVDGDGFQANVAYKALGAGSGATVTTASSESYLTRFVPSPYKDGGRGDSDLSSYTVLDRAFEYNSRSGGSTNAQWRLGEPNHLQTTTTTMSNGGLQLDVVWRIVELPSDQGFGSQELVKITDGPFLRAALVKRRFRRNFDAQQNRVVEGLEVIKTFRVLDGVAGTELPTSTIKSQLYLTRPRGDGYDVPSGAY